MTTRSTWALFDLDGCLIDSSRTIPAAVNAGLAGVGLPAQDPGSLQWCIGPPLRHSYERLVGELHGRPSPALVTAAVDAYREAFPEIARASTTLVPGMLDALAATAQRRAIVTSKPRDAAAPLVHAMGLAEHVEEVFGPAMDHQVEHKVDTLARARRALGIALPTDAAMVGDRCHDVDAGRAHGCRTIGVTWGAGDRAELAGADAVLEDPADLPATLDELLPRARP